MDYWPITSKVLPPGGEIVHLISDDKRVARMLQTWRDTLNGHYKAQIINETSLQGSTKVVRQPWGSPGPNLTKWRTYGFTLFTPKFLARNLIKVREMESTPFYSRRDKSQWRTFISRLFGREQLYTPLNKENNQLFAASSQCIPRLKFRRASRFAAYLLEGCCWLFFVVQK